MSQSLTKFPVKVSKKLILFCSLFKALEAAQWVKLTSRGADLTIYAGDFNTEPCDAPYNLLTGLAGLTDCWLERHCIEKEGGRTCGTGFNSYSGGCEAKRIDYIMYRVGDRVSAYTEECLLPLQPRIPSANVSYSDHEAVHAVLRLEVVEADRRPKKSDWSGREDTLSLSLQYIERAEGRTERDRTFYTILTVIIILGIKANFMFDCAMFLATSGLAGLAFYSFCMATIFNRCVLLCRLYYFLRGIVNS